MKLIGYFRSGASYRVRIALNLKGIGVEHAFKHLRKGEHKASDYLEVNPQGLVPTLFTDDGAALTQSIAILEWLEETCPAPAMLPKDPIARARVRAFALAIACDATFVLQGPGGQRRVKAEDFFIATYTTALADDEILVAIRVPAFAAGTGWAYEKLKRKTGDWATAGCAVVLRKSGNTVTHIRIGLTNVAPTALRAEAAEAALLNQPFTPENVAKAAEAAMAVCEPAEDLRGDAEYKTAMAGEMVKRALQQAWSRAQ